MRLIYQAAIYQLMKQGRYNEALAIYRWFRPLLDLDARTYLMQNIKLVEVHAIGTNDRVRMPRQPLATAARLRKRSSRTRLPRARHCRSTEPCIEVIA